MWRNQHPSSVFLILRKPRLSQSVCFWYTKIEEGVRARSVGCWDQRGSLRMTPRILNTWRLLQLIVLASLGCQFWSGRVDDRGPSRSSPHPCNVAGFHGEEYHTRDVFIVKKTRVLVSLRMLIIGRLTLRVSPYVSTPTRPRSSSGHSADGRTGVDCQYTGLIDRCV
jgi:hypothetical protein